MIAEKGSFRAAVSAAIFAFGISAGAIFCPVTAFGLQADSWRFCLCVSRHPLLLLFCSVCSGRSTASALFFWLRLRLRGSAMTRFWKAHWDFWAGFSRIM